MAEPERIWTVYLAGEIHSDWRERIANGIEQAGLPVVLTSPVTDHGASDAYQRGKPDQRARLGPRKSSFVDQVKGHEGLTHRVGHGPHGAVNQEQDHV